MEFLLFLIFLIFTTILTGVVGYYANLLFFNAKENYPREEITEIWGEVLQSTLNLFESGGNLSLGGILFLATSLFVWFWSLLGGLIGTPHYSNAMGNYFFQFPFLFLAFLFSYPFLKDAFGVSGSGKLFFENGRPVLAGLGLGTWSANLSAWGLYHELYFLFVLLSGIVVLWPLIYYWNGLRFFSISIGPAERFTSHWEENIYEEDEDPFSPPTDRRPPPRPAPKTSSVAPVVPTTGKKTIVEEEGDIDFNPFAEEDQDSYNFGYEPPTSDDWDEIEEGALGDEAPTLDDFDIK